MEKTIFTFLFNEMEQSVELEGSYINDEGLRTFEVCNGEYLTTQRFKAWLTAFDNRKKLSEFLKERSDFSIQIQGKK